MKSLIQYWKSFREFLLDREVYGFSLEDILIKFFFLTVLILTVTWLMPSERPFEYANLKIGNIATEEIIAPFKFPILKTENELKREREAARAKVLMVFNRDGETDSRQQIRIGSFFDELGTFFKKYPLSSVLHQALDPVLLDANKQSVDSFLVQFKLKYNVNLNQDQLVRFYQLYKDERLSKLANFLGQTLSISFKNGILDRPRTEISGTEIIVVDDGIEETRALEDLQGMGEAQMKISSLLRNRYESNSLELTGAELVIPAFLSPNLNYDAEVTQERVEQAVHDVPLASGFVEQDERIIDSNEKITADVFQKLHSLEVAQKERSAAQKGFQQLQFLAGKGLFAFTVLFLTIIYLILRRRTIFHNNRLIGMFTIILLLQFVVAGIIQLYTEWPALTIPVVLAPMLIAMLLDSGLAMISTVSVSLILGSAMGNDYTFTFNSLVVGSMAIYAVQKIRNRREMFRAILLILLAYLTINLIDGFIHMKAVTTILRNFAYFSMPSGILAPVVVFFLVGLFERYFDVTTDITLLELSDLNHPLLKRLSVEAPGTFHHSIVVANLAEAASLAINANALQTRVGCYFHDIGKMVKPEYFVENQMGGPNKHDNLSPHMSTLILINHVKEGAKMAAKHNLPRIITNFITEHHGTSLISYFYHKALENKGKDGKAVNEIDFRYPGPRPKTKETGIAMLADTVEAASRALQNPTPQRIRNLVDELVNKKLEEQQFDECNLTLKEISRIKEAFIPIITGIHHVRIEYPESDKDKRGNRDKNGKATQSEGAKESKTPPATNPPLEEKGKTQ